MNKRILLTQTGRQAHMNARTNAHARAPAHARARRQGHARTRFMTTSLVAPIARRKQRFRVAGFAILCAPEWLEKKGDVSSPKIKKTPASARQHFVTLLRILVKNTTKGKEKLGLTYSAAARKFRTWRKQVSARALCRMNLAFVVAQPVIVTYNNLYIYIYIY